LIDTETTALDGVVCEIGVIAGDGSILFHSLVNPECPMWPIMWILTARLAQSARRYCLQELTQEWECAMEAYAAYCGNWSDYHGDYTWIPLAGNPRAVGDALAALERVREMAAVYEREYASPAEVEQS